MPEDLDEYLGTGIHLRREVGEGHVASERMPVGAAPKPGNHSPLGVDRLTSVDRDVLLVSHDDGSDPRPSTIVAGQNQRVPSDELTLLQLNAEPQ